MKTQLHAASRLKAAQQVKEEASVVSMDVPLLIRVLEIAREELKTDADLHKFVTSIVQQQATKSEPLTMEDYDIINPTPTEVEAAEKWSQPITDSIEKDTTKQKPPEGLFTESADAIARGLKKIHPDLSGAVSSLNFYRNRAGKNLNEAEGRKLDQALDKLRNLYPESKE